jgi:hypothetical protein
MDQEDSFCLTTRIKGPKAMAVVCLRAFRHERGINQTDRLKFKDSYVYTDQLTRFVRVSNLENEGNCTFVTTFGREEWM